MPYKDNEIAEGSWSEYFTGFPGYPSRILFLDFLVKYFPRRLLRVFSPSTEEKFIYHILLFRNDLQTYHPAGPHPGFSLLEIDRSSVIDLAEHHEGLPMSVYKSRLDAGDRCYCLIHDGRIVGYNWASANACSIFCGFDRQVFMKSLQEHEIFLYDYYVYSSERGRGYGRILKDCLLANLKNAGKHCTYAAVSFRNPLSVKIHLTLGSYLYAMFYNYRIMGWAVSVKATKKETLAAAQWLRVIFGDTRQTDTH